MENTIKVAYKKTQQLHERRKVAITLLENSLESGIKPPKKGVTYSEIEVFEWKLNDRGEKSAIISVKLSAKDIAKKQLELNTLKARV